MIAIRLLFSLFCFLCTYHCLSLSSLKPTLGKLERNPPAKCMYLNRCTLLPFNCNPCFWYKVHTSHTLTNRYFNIVTWSSGLKAFVRCDVINPKCTLSTSPTRLSNFIEGWLKSKYLIVVYTRKLNHQVSIFIKIWRCLSFG